MSVRAYKVITKEVEKNCSFNLSHDDDLIEMLKSQGEYSEEGGSLLSISVPSIKYVLENFKWEKEDYRPDQFKKDIEGLTDDDWVEYECY